MKMTREKGNSFLSFLIELPVLIIIAVVIAWVIKSFIVQPFYIPSSSMEPTLYPGDHVLVNKFTYYFREPRYQDIIVFRYPIDPKKDFIKRVIATEEQTVQALNGKAIVDGKVLNEPYIASQGDSSNFGPIEVSSGKLFVMGDNRKSSFDSRVFGQLPQDNVLGKAFFIYWPPNRIRIVR